MADNLSADELELYSMVANQLRTFSARNFPLGGEIRAIEEECKHPNIYSLRAEDYREMHDKFGVAERVNFILSDESWNITPEVFETFEDETETEWELAWKELGRSLGQDFSPYTDSDKQGFFEDEQSSPLWDAMFNLDRLSGIGRYGVMLLGLDKGELSEPFPGMEDERFLPSKGGKTLLPSPREGTKLLYVQTLDESLVDIAVTEPNIRSSRYGLPKEYLLTLNDPMIEMEGIGQESGREVRVHWSRVIHVADNTASSRVYGTPRSQNVFHHLVDLRKLYGGSAEMYWQGAFPGISFETHPQLGNMVKLDPTAMKKMVSSYFEGLQRYLATTGATAKTLSPQVVDPTQQIERQLDAICIKLGVPKRVFMGSERGELASSQDKDTHEQRISRRRKRFITPRIIQPTISRLIRLGVLPVPKSLHVEWDEDRDPTPMELADIATKRVTAISTYIQSGADIMMPPVTFLSEELGYDLEHAEKMLEEAEELSAEKEAEEAEMFPPAPPLPGQPPVPGQPGVSPAMPPGKPGLPPKGIPQPAPKGQPAGKGVPPKVPLTANAADEGVWRTGDDGQKIFIKDGEVRAGGPKGPVLSKGKEETKPTDLGRWANPLDALKEYQSGMYGSKLGGYSAIQEQLYGVSSSIDKKELEQLTSSLDKAFMPSPVDRTLYRGVRNPKVVLNGATVGDTIDFRGYMSTSTDLKVAKRFSETLNKGDKPTIVEIRSKAGTPEINNVAKVTGVDAGLGRPEKETLLKRGVKFRVLKITPSKIVLETIPEISANVASIGLTSNAEGVWRTTDDGSRIYIKGDEVRAGGPNGPVLRGGKGGADPKEKEPGQEPAKAPANVDKALKELGYSVGDLSSIPGDFQELLVSSLKDIKEDFPGIENYTGTIRTSKLPDGVPLTFRVEGGSKSLLIDPSQLTPKSLKEIEKAQNSGWLASKEGWKGIVAHELAHVVDKTPFSTTFKWGIHNAKTYLKKNPPSAKDLSRYGTQAGPHQKEEMFAEAFAAAYTQAKPNAWQKGFNASLKKGLTANAESQGKATPSKLGNRKLNKPFRTPGGTKKFAVYVRNDKGDVVLVRFGDPNMEIKRDDPERRANFRARHGCDTDPGPKWKPKYWACKTWTKTPVSEVVNVGTFVANKIVQLSSDQWRVVSSQGKNLGTFRTKEQAEKRLRQVEFFKHNEDQKTSKEELTTNSDSNCGIGKDGFQPGNTCAKGGGQVGTSLPDIEFSEETLEEITTGHRLNLLDKKGRHKILLSLGIEQASIDELDSLFDSHRQGGAGQESADREIHDHYGRDTNLGKAIRAQVHLEEQLYTLLEKTKPAWVDQREVSSMKEMEDAWKKGYPPKNDYAYESWQYQWETEQKYQFDQQREQQKFYRKGGADKDVLPTSTKKEGAQAYSVTGAAQPKFTPDNEWTAEELHAKGYKILGGFAYGSMGYQGEGEVTWIKDPRSITANNCGIGKGGFQPGNTCAKGGGGGGVGSVPEPKFISSNKKNVAENLATVQKMKALAESGNVEELVKTPGTGSPKVEQYRQDLLKAIATTPKPAKAKAAPKSKSKQAADLSALRVTLAGQLGLSEEDIAEAVSGDASPSKSKQAQNRTRIASAILEMGLEQQDAVLSLKDDPQARSQRVQSIASGDVAKAQKEYKDTPVYDLNTLGAIEVKSVPVPGQAVCYMQERRVVMGSTSATGDYRHELGHALHASMGTSSALALAVESEYKDATKRFKADPPPAGAKLTHEEYETKYGVVGRRGLDNHYEHAAEHYRLYHREIYRDKYEGGGGKHLGQYRQRHPGWARIWDAHYTAAKLGNQS